MVKLSDRKIRWIVTHCHIKRDVSTKEAAQIYGVSVRRIQQIIKAYSETGKTKPNPKKQRRRKRCGYERKQSGSLVHGDWHRSDESKPYAIVWIDDASRKILDYGEFETATTEHSIKTLVMAIAHASQYRIVIRKVNTDRGTQFYSNRGGKSQFQMYLEEQRIRHVVSRKTILRRMAKLKGSG